MTIQIDSDIPVPEDAWVSTPAKLPKREPKVITETNPSADNWVKARFMPEGSVECFLVGGPLNGQRGPVKGNAKTVELELYGPNGEVTSVELYALGDTDPTPTVRYYVGSKQQ